jgi:nitroreductase
MKARASADSVKMSNAEVVLEAIRSRRVARDFTSEPLTKEQLDEILTAGRWAATAGNRRINRFLVVQDPRSLKLVRSIAPGIWAKPTALIIICVDLDLARQDLVQIERDPSIQIDVGTAAMNMMLAAHAIGVGSCPVTSYSRSGLSKMLDLPANAIPEFILQLGIPTPQALQGHAGRGRRVTAADLTFWERYGRSLPGR